jgi:hypothetical protein
VQWSTTERDFSKTLSSFLLLAGIELTDNLKVGYRIRIPGHAAGLEMVVESMQVDNKSASEDSAGPARQQDLR